MKKLLALLLALTLLLSMTACADLFVDCDFPDYTNATRDTADLPLIPQATGTGPRETKPAATRPVQSGMLDIDGSYTTKEDVALYLCIYKKLPSNFITKKEARQLGWDGGGLEPFAPGKCIGGDRFGNYEDLLPYKEGRVYYECDIDTLGAKFRGEKRIVYSSDGLIYYTADHYESFTLLYDGG